MRCAIVKDNTIVNIINAEPGFMGSIPLPEGAGIGWQLVDDVWTAPVEAVDPAKVIAEIVKKVQKRLDDFARTRAYDGILSACTYATSTVTKFQTEGQYCVNARDATWSKCYEILAEVENNIRPPVYTYEEIESELPVLQWPN